jgi:hypothetical protein
MIYWWYYHNHFTYFFLNSINIYNYHSCFTQGHFCQTWWVAQGSSIHQRIQCWTLLAYRRTPTNTLCSCNNSKRTLPTKQSCHLWAR